MKFEVDEIAIVAVAAKLAGGPYVGDEVKIVRPFLLYGCGRSIFLLV